VASRIASEKARTSDSVSLPAEASESGNSTDHLNSGARAQSRFPFPFTFPARASPSLSKPHGSGLQSPSPWPRTHRRAFESARQQTVRIPNWPIGSSVVQGRENTQRPSTPPMLMRECKDFSVRRHVQRALYSNLDCVMASSRHCRAGNGNSDSDWKSHLQQILFTVCQSLYQHAFADSDANRRSLRKFWALLFSPSGLRRQIF
jgi:hypothetical protein